MDEAERNQSPWERAVKSRVRAEFRSFLRPIVNRLGPKNTSYACLPGEEGLEIAQIVDKLGISHAHVLAFEHDEDRVVRFRKNFPRVAMLHSDIFEGLEHIIRNRSGTIDILNLDLQGHISERLLKTLKSLREEGILNDLGCVAVTFLAMREKAKFQLYEKSVRKIADVERVLSIARLMTRYKHTPSDVYEDIEALSKSLEDDKEEVLSLGGLEGWSNLTFCGEQAPTKLNTVGIPIGDVKALPVRYGFIAAIRYAVGPVCQRLTINYNSGISDMTMVIYRLTKPRGTAPYQINGRTVEIESPKPNKPARAAVEEWLRKN